MKRLINRWLHSLDNFRGSPAVAVATVDQSGPSSRDVKIAELLKLGVITVTQPNEGLEEFESEVDTVDVAEVVEGELTSLKENESTID